MAEQNNSFRGTCFPSIVTSARGYYAGNRSGTAVSGFNSRFYFPRGRHGNTVDENLQRDRNINPHCVNRNKLIGI
jgi:hypothetical protein